MLGVLKKALTYFQGHYLGLSSFRYSRNDNSLPSAYVTVDFPAALSISLAVRPVGRTPEMKPLPRPYGRGFGYTDTRIVSALNLFYLVAQYIS